MECPYGIGDVRSFPEGTGVDVGSGVAVGGSGVFVAVGGSGGAACDSGAEAGGCSVSLVSPQATEKINPTTTQKIVILDSIKKPLHG